MSSAVIGFAGSLGASAFGAVAGDIANSTLGTIAFGVLSGGIGAELSDGNFWQGAVIGSIVAGINHAMHRIDDNGYDRNGNRINNKGGDEIDYKYDDSGNIISSKPVNIIRTGKFGQDFETYGLRVYNVKSGSLYDPSFDIFTTYVGGGIVKRFITGAKFIYKTKVGGQFTFGYLDKPTKFMIRLEKHSLPKIGGGRGYPTHINIEKAGKYNKHIFPNPKDWGKYKVR